MKAVTVLFIDLETGGLDPRENVVLSLGACLARISESGELVTTLFGDAMVVDPRIDDEGAVEPKALEVNGLTLSDVKRNGDHPGHVMERLRFWLDEQITDADLVDGRSGPRLLIGGQNFGTFDYQFLQTWDRLFGVKLPPHSRRFIDTATVLHLMRMGGDLHDDAVSLVDACLRLGLGISAADFHTAAHDALACARVFHHFLTVSMT